MLCELDPWAPRRFASPLVVLDHQGIPLVDMEAGLVADVLVRSARCVEPPAAFELDMVAAPIGTDRERVILTSKAEVKCHHIARPHDLAAMTTEGQRQAGGIRESNEGSGCSIVTWKGQGIVPCLAPGSPYTSNTCST